MAAVIVEWVRLSSGPGFDGGEVNIIKAVHGQRAALAVTAAPTAAAERPVAPAGGDMLYARVTALAGNIVVAWGDDPTADQLNGVSILAGGVEPIPVLPGQRLSFVELA
jgi:hypothetical protein